MTNVALVAAWLETHTGFHRPMTIAVEVGITPHQAAVALRYLYEKGQIDRVQVTHRGWCIPTGYYSAVEGKVLPPTRQPWGKGANRKVRNE